MQDTSPFRNIMISQDSYFEINKLSLAHLNVDWVGEKDGELRWSFNALFIMPER